MVKHLTVRLAWHDNKWNGKVCEDPESNVYCVGSHSLLSSRIEKNRDLDIEKKNKGKRIDKLGKYLPPCYWSTNAFSKQALTVWHNHPFSNYANSHVIKDKLSGYSVFTWPFHLSFNHGEKKLEQLGSYPPDLDVRIDQFQKSFTKDKSIVFFYLNHDNPISADEIVPKFALVGCATLNKIISPPKEFKFDPSTLARLRKPKKMQNYSPLNWAMMVSYDFDSGVLLPYHEYLEDLAKFPEHEGLKDEMKVLIDEKFLQENFKYVAMDMDDDACIYLLTRLRKSFEKIRGHGIIPATRAEAEIEKIDKLLERSWKARGTYPSLGSILDLIADNAKVGIGNEIVSAVEKNKQKKEDTLEIIAKLLTKKNIPKYLDNDEFTPTIDDMYINMKDYNLELVRKLSLFSLSPTQIKNILTEDSASFKKLINVDDIVKNPYLLCEHYKGSEHIDRDEWQKIPDKNIGTFTIDIGMFPDSRYLRRNTALQDLTVHSPERVRAIITDHLKSLENNGHCYATLDEIFEMLQNYPLFYRDEDSFSVNKSKLVHDKYMQHFQQRLEVVKKEFFYLNEIKEAENVIKDTILELLKREDYKTKVDDLDKYLDTQADELTTKIGSNFNRPQFIKERTKLVEGCIKKSFFVITGKPGTGKTQALKKIIEELKNESFQILAPTGKASLRLKTATGDRSTKTVHLLITSAGNKKILDDFEDFSSSRDLGGTSIQNLIIDETSMVDLKTFAVLLKMLHDKKNSMKDIKRIILVGDENQLPPIGYGRPFFDIIELLTSDKKYRDENCVNLETNCRQEFDEEILKIIDLFRGRKTCYEEPISQISSGKFSSPGFNVQLWDNATELYQKVSTRLEYVVKKSVGKIPKDKPSQLNRLFCLNEDGSVQNDYTFEQTMNLDSWQLITPYRGGYFGTLGLNDYIKSEYREHDPREDQMWGKKIPFTHADKIICIKNQYQHSKLQISNGSMGLVNIRDQPQLHKKFYFPDKAENGGLKYLPGATETDSPYELAYGITIHKSQGSEFGHTFVVLPKKRALLTRELIYTALSRSTGEVTLFLQKTSDDEKSILEEAINKSAILPRKTSIFTEPKEQEIFYEPRKGGRVKVKSKIEYILYEALEGNGIDVTYEEPLKLETLNDDGSFNMHPDFTIKINGKKLFVEHLGMIDDEYWQQWAEVKRPTYEKNGIFDDVITTVDNNKPPDKEKINGLINDLINDTIKETTGSKFSNHHYELN